MTGLRINHRMFDAHFHLRDGQMLGTVAPIVAGNFWGGIVMPNLLPPIVTTEDAVNYRQRIDRALPEDTDFTPLITLYLTDTTDPEDVARGFEAGIIKAVKKYPLHGTHNSAAAVTDLAKVTPVLRMMEEIDIPLLIHGEQVTLGDEPLNPLKREPFYVRGELDEILEMFPDLRVSLEHISTKEAAELIAKYGSERLVATVTPQHLVTHIGATMYTTDGSYMPCAKDWEDMMALRELIASGCEWIHLGTDFAPHDEAKKNAVHCACGAFTPHAPELYLEAFEAANCLHLFEEFACLRGPRFFDLEPEPGDLLFVKEPWQFDDFVTSYGEMSTHDFDIRPFGYRTPEEERAYHRPNRTMTWRRVE